MKNWLDNFANGINLDHENFILPDMLLISILTVSYHTLKTAHLSPVDTLKYDRVKGITILTSSF